MRHERKAPPSLEKMQWTALSTLDMIFAHNCAGCACNMQSVVVPFYLSVALTPVPSALLNVIQHLQLALLEPSGVLTFPIRHPCWRNDPLSSFTIFGFISTCRLFSCTRDEEEPLVEPLLFFAVAPCPSRSILNAVPQFPPFLLNFLFCKYLSVKVNPKLVGVTISNEETVQFIY